MIKKILTVIIIAVFFAITIGCTQTNEKSIIAFVGSASKPPMEEAAAVFVEETGIKVYLNFGGSGTMLSQIELSQSGDVYIPGSPDFIVKAEKKELIDRSTIKQVAYLIPVISVRHGNPENIQSLADLAKPGIEVGIGNPQSVCLGIYAVEILDHNNLLADIGKNIVVNTESCEKTATLLSLKSVDAVIGWDVFHHWDAENIDTVYIEPEQLPRLGYIPAAVTKYTVDRESAQKFLDFLVSEKGREIFKKWGYITTESDAREFAPGAQIGGEYNLPASYEPLVK